MQGLNRVYQSSFFSHLMRSTNRDQHIHHFLQKNTTSPTAKTMPVSLQQAGDLILLSDLILP